MSLEGGKEAAGGVGGCQLPWRGRGVLLIRPQHRLATPTQQVQHSVVVLRHHHTKHETPFFTQPFLYYSFKIGVFAGLETPMA